MELWKSLLLGILQGITEWLPISSSGHLVILQQILDVDPPLMYDILLHFATALVIVFYLRTEILDIIKGFIKGSRAIWGSSSAKMQFRTNRQFRMGLLIIIGSIPTAILGLFFEILISQSSEGLYSSLLLVGLSLLITGTILIMSRKAHTSGNFRRLSPKIAWGIGLMQGLAVLPGISRSGGTISMGIRGRLSPEVAFQYSLLLAIPAILGATLFHLPDLFARDVQIDMAMIVGIAAAAVAAYFVIDILRKIVHAGTFYLFAFYCIPLGIGCIIWSFVV